MQWRGWVKKSLVMAKLCNARAKSSKAECRNGIVELSRAMAW